MSVTRAGANEYIRRIKNIERASSCWSTSTYLDLVSLVEPQPADGQEGERVVKCYYRHYSAGDAGTHALSYWRQGGQYAGNRGRTPHLTGKIYNYILCLKPETNYRLLLMLCCIWIFAYPQSYHRTSNCQNATNSQLTLEPQAK